MGDLVPGIGAFQTGVGFQTGDGVPDKGGVPDRDDAVPDRA